MERDYQKPLRVIVVGGSLAGLMCGVALREAGHNVTIVEQDGDERESHMSGICLGPSAMTFLDRFNCSPGTFSHETDCLQVLRTGREPRILAKGRRIITSWDTLYYRLRAAFDGYTSPYFPSPPQRKHSPGTATYSSNTKVLSLERIEHDLVKIEVTLQDQASGTTYKEQADFVIGADGPNSFVRMKYSPDIQRRFSGYVAWRGVVQEDQVSAATRQVFNQGVTLYPMKRQHCVVYTIPGVNGSVEPGKRRLNFLWYTNEDDGSMKDIMVDAVDGHHHRFTVPAGHVRSEVWSARVEEAKRLGLPAPWFEVVSKIDQPFIQVISEFCSPQAVFEDGKVLLVGDALSLFCPHTGLSGAQAAFHSMRVADYISGQLSMIDLEREVLGYSYIYWLQSVYWGQFNQGSTLSALTSGVRYWATYVLDKLNLWWLGKPSSRPNEFLL
ncbi:hypothetical protein GGR54DRAFT_319997 [Hypoxylon sp. NC1633]|nr:hypothetical protein GGR54DRAFT_319997 [Hypoxylon sp. NC1633]